METTLHLNLKKKWFDMIASGEKKVEYRNPSEYWYKRLSKFNPEQTKCTITFSNGYAKDRRQMVVELLSFGYGTGRKDWGAVEGVGYYKLRLGEILSRNF